MALFNNITQDFYDNLNNLGSNPFILIVLIVIILIYYILFSFVGKSYDYGSVQNSDTSHSTGFYIIEALLWGIFILLVFVNGLAYFFSINVITEIKNIFSQEPEINISTVVDQQQQDISLNFEEVYHVPGNRFTYHDAKAVCKAFDGDIATYNQLNESNKKGASWCSYGWTNEQLGLYPTSQTDWTKLQAKEGHKYDCGLPGINGGYVPNPHTKLGANCYGVKPKQSELEKQYVAKDLYPKTTKELLFDQRVQFWKERIGNVLITPFNSDNWFKVP
jgi:hypothetical protein